MGSGARAPVLEGLAVALDARRRGVLPSRSTRGAAQVRAIVEVLAMATGRIKTRRWNDRAEDDDGFRLLVTRFRPRGVRKDAETWDDWWPRLGPSPELVAAFYGKRGPALPWAEYRERYLVEMSREAVALHALAWRVGGGETVTLLCSSACVDPDRCHRSLLKGVVEAEVALRAVEARRRGRG